MHVHRGVVVGRELGEFEIVGGEQGEGARLRHPVADPRRTGARGRADHAGDKARLGRILRGEFVANLAGQLRAGDEVGGEDAARLLPHQAARRHPSRRADQDGKHGVAGIAHARDDEDDREDPQES